MLSVDMYNIYFNHFMYYIHNKIKRRIIYMSVHMFISLVDGICDPLKSGLALWMNFGIM